MSNIFQIPVLNPLRFVWQSDKLPSDASTAKYKAFNPQHNYRNFDDDFFARSLKFYETSERYLQPYQQCDIVRGQFAGSDGTAAHYTARLLDQYGNVVTSKTITLAQHSGAYGYIYTCEFSLWDVPEGIYCVQLRYDHTGSYSYLPSEFIHVKQIHPKSVRFEYINSYTDQDLINFSDSFIYQLRVNGCITQFTPSSDFSTYEDQGKNMKMVSGIPIRQFELSLFQIPDWMADKIERLFINDTVRINGVLWCRDSGSKLEPKGEAINPLRDYTIKLRESENTISVTHNVNTKVLCDMPQTKYFWIERIMMESVYYTIRQGFNGKRNLLDYLNTSAFNDKGYWSEDAKGQLVFYANDDYTFTGNWVIDAVDLLKYGMKLELSGAGDIGIDVVATAGTQSYAAIWGGGAATVNKTALAATPTITTLSKTWAVSYNHDCYIYASDYISLNDNATNIKILSIDCDIAAGCTFFVPFTTASSCTSFKSNPFRFVTALNTFNIQGMNLDTWAINDMCRNIFDCLPKFATTASVYLNNQTPAAPPTKMSMASILDAIKKRLTTFITD